MKVMRFGLAEFFEQRNQQDWLHYLRTAGASNTGAPCLVGSTSRGLVVAQVCLSPLL